MTERTAMMPTYPSNDVTIGATGKAETDPVPGPANSIVVIDVYTNSVDVRVAHGASGVDPASGYILVPTSRNTIEIQAGEVLAFGGAENDVITWTVMT